MNTEHEEQFKNFQEKTGVSFQNLELLKTAFTHRSYLNEVHAEGEHNERLEFLGDAVLELVVTTYLFNEYPDTPEGQLTAYRAALVNTTMLGTVSEDLGMNDCLLLSKGEAKDTGRARVTILANTFEAFVGALYLDQGYDAAATFIGKYIISRAPEVVQSGSWKDAKSAFQEFAQAKYGVTPQYEVVRADGPDHDKHFVVSVSISDVSVSEGEGNSKQEAEQKAAEHALSNADAEK